MKPRFSLAAIAAAIGSCGVAFAALRSPSHLWANATYTGVCIALVLAAINVAFSRGRSRAFWAGFLMAGGAYFTAYSVPALRESIGPRLLTEPLLDLLYAQVSPPQPAPTTLTGTLIGVGSGMAGSGYATMMGSMQQANARWRTGSITAGPSPAAAPPSRWAAWTTPDRNSGVGYQIGSISLVSPEPFRQVGHSLMILLFAAFGGIYARSRYDRQAREG
jgi:hypothetical protein